MRSGSSWSQGHEGMRAAAAESSSAARATRSATSTAVASAIVWVRAYRVLLQVDGGEGGRLQRALLRHQERPARAVAVAVAQAPARGRAGGAASRTCTRAAGLCYGRACGRTGGCAREQGAERHGLGGRSGKPGVKRLVGELSRLAEMCSERVCAEFEARQRWQHLRPPPPAQRPRRAVREGAVSPCKQLRHSPS